MNLKKIQKLLILTAFLILFTSNKLIVFGYNDSDYFYLGGFPLGFDLSGNGALIVGLTEVICEDDIYLPAKDAGLKCGDYILSLNGKNINSASDIDLVLKGYSQGAIIAEILSNGEKQVKNLYPKKDLSGTYKLGVLIRDYLSGLGTVTLIDKEGNFCSLGHPIVDEEGKLLGVGGGNVYSCNVIGVEKGERGKAGELKGTIIRSDPLGVVKENCLVGLLGKFTLSSNYKNLKKFQLGEPTIGDAEVYTTISGTKPMKYKISIVKVDLGEKQNKNMVIKITDDKLVRYTGGIVQGMSGSPIIQNGKIVGAVTHVFLNDSTRGYAISIGKMTNFLEQSIA